MKWVNHQATAFCMTMAVTANPVLGIITAVASSLPDAIEMTKRGNKVAAHRGISHDIIFWGPILLCLLFVTHWPGVLSFMPICAGIPQTVGLGVVLGVIMHLMTDGMSKGGIPILRKYRFAAGLYKTFTLSEYKVSLLICLPCLVTAWALGHLSWKFDSMTSYLCG